MLILPEALTALTPAELYASLDDLRAHRRVYGRGRTPEAAHIRAYCSSEAARLHREIRRRGLPAQRPDANTWVRQPAGRKKSR